MNRVIRMFVCSCNRMFECGNSTFAYALIETHTAKHKVLHQMYLREDIYISESDRYIGTEILKIIDSQWKNISMYLLCRAFACLCWCACAVLVHVCVCTCVYIWVCMVWVSSLFLTSSFFFFFMKQIIPMIATPTANCQKCCKHAHTYGNCTSRKRVPQPLAETTLCV